MVDHFIFALNVWRQVSSRCSQLDSLKQTFMQFLFHGKWTKGKLIGFDTKKKLIETIPHFYVWWNHRNKCDNFEKAKRQIVICVSFPTYMFFI